MRGEICSQNGRRHACAHVAPRGHFFSTIANLIRNYKTGRKLTRLFFSATEVILSCRQLISDQDAPQRLPYPRVRQGEIILYIHSYICSSYVLRRMPDRCSDAAGRRSNGATGSRERCQIRIGMKLHIIGLSGVVVYMNKAVVHKSRLFFLHTFYDKQEIHWFVIVGILDRG